MKPGRAVIWMMTIFPCVVVGVVLYLHAIPASERELSINLVGTFRVLRGDSPLYAAPEFDDSAWENDSLPAFRPAHDNWHWARRHFVLPPALAGRQLYFAAGGLWPGSQIFLNGQFIGQADRRVRGEKVEDFSIEGWSVPASAVREGDNVLALRMPAFVLQDSRLLLGEQESLRSYVLLNVTFKGMVLHGSLFLCVFLVLLLCALYAQSDEVEQRSRLRVALQVLLASSIYLAVNTGLFPTPDLTPLHILAFFSSILFSVVSYVEFFESYLTGKRSRVARGIRWVGAGYFLTLCSMHLLGHHQALFDFWVTVIGPSLMVPLLWSLWVALIGSYRNWELVGPPLAFGALNVVIASVCDVLTPQQVTSLPRLSPVSTANLAILVGVMVTRDFLKISSLNKDLTRALRVSNDELGAALVQAQEVARLKGEFVANMSHELRTPLNSIINVPQGLLKQFHPVRAAECRACSTRFTCEPDEAITASIPCPQCEQLGGLVESREWNIDCSMDEVVGHLSALERSGNGLLRLVEDVLDFSKAEAGRMKLVREETPASRIVNEVMDTLRPLADAKKITVRSDLAAEGPVWVDRVKISQVMINLLGNAIKFSPEGSEIVIRSNLSDGQLILSVADTGGGIPKEYQSIIFESFRQVDGSHTRRYGGTGLGLAIVKQLVELHGGRVWVESEPGNGSVFFVSLSTESSAANEPIQSTASGADTILVMDDEPSVAQTIRLCLRDMRCNIVSVVDPVEFKNEMTRLRPGLVILDIMLPRMSGLDLLKMIGELGPSWGDPAVLVSSAYDANRAIVEAQGWEWISKPWRNEAFAARVQALLAKRRALNLVA